jgi:hypothetical protein
VRCIWVCSAMRAGLGWQACSGKWHTGPPTRGEVAERLKAHAWNACRLERVTSSELTDAYRWLTDGLRSRLRVRIQLAPPGRRLRADFSIEVHEKAVSYLAHSLIRDV